MAKKKPTQQPQEPLKPTVSGNNNESRELLGIPLAGPGFVAAVPLETIQVTPVTEDHEGTKAALVRKRTLDDGTVVNDWA